LTQPPPSAVLEAFGLQGEPTALTGGQGTSWRVDSAVVKPLDLSLEELEWQAGLTESVSFEGVRVPRPLRARNGSLVSGGWSAWEHVEGGSFDDRWGDVIRAGERFHHALRHEPRPAFLDTRSHPWAIGDRVAWGELAADDYENVKHVRRLGELRRPLDLSKQVVHGDLTQNVLLAERLPPAVIDLSPYWRPPGFASAIVVADAIGMGLADEALLAEVAHVEDFPQLFVRAVIYRAVTDRLFRLDEPLRADESDPYLPLADLAERLVTGPEW
jgi:uncharacterized protein (TIGR02569 family)